MKLIVPPSLRVLSTAPQPLRVSNPDLDFQNVLQLQANVARPPGPSLRLLQNLLTGYHLPIADTGT